MKNRNTRRGFTLIELLVVVLIIGILSAVAVPQYQKAVFKARATEAVLMISTVQKAVDAYILEHGWGTEYKDITDELDISIPTSACFGRPSVTFEYSNSSDYYYSTGLGSASLTSCEQGLALVVDKYPTGNWRKSCWYYANTPSESFCRELEKQGWEINDLTPSHN